MGISLATAEQERERESEKRGGKEEKKSIFPCMNGDFVHLGVNLYGLSIWKLANCHQQ